MSASPVAVWIAIRSEVAWQAVFLAAAVFFWVGGFDIIYACQDVEFDRQRKLFSIPVRFGVGSALRLAAVSHLCMLACLIGLWRAADLGWVFAVGVLLVACLLVYEHWLVRPDDLARVNLAFFHVNAVISVGLFVVALADILLVHS